MASDKLDEALKNILQDKSHGSEGIYAKLESLEKKIKSNTKVLEELKDLLRKAISE